MPRAGRLTVTGHVVSSRVQLVSAVPVVVLYNVKLTVPDGVFAGVVVSETVAVQVDVPPMLIDAGAQTTVVEVLSSCPGVTLMAAEVPELPLWVESPP